MSSRPKTLTLLPPDGQVLEELISQLQTEYGRPATPQEYRLLIKVPVPAGTSTLEAQPTDALRLDPVDDEETPDGEPKRKRRRRRRGRRRPAGEGQPEVSDSEDEAPTEEGLDLDGFMDGPVEVSDPSTSGTLAVDQPTSSDIQSDPEVGLNG